MDQYLWLSVVLLFSDAAGTLNHTKSHTRNLLLEQDTLYFSDYDLLFILSKK